MGPYTGCSAASIGLLLGLYWLQKYSVAIFIFEKLKLPKKPPKFGIKYIKTIKKSKKSIKKVRVAVLAGGKPGQNLALLRYEWLVVSTPVWAGDPDGATRVVYSPFFF